MLAEDKSRTSAQTQRIISRLRSGPATNVELAEIALKYTGRISDARKLGYDIKCRREAAGVTVYWLAANGAKQAPNLGPLFEENI